MAEALLPHTDAISKGTVEFAPYRGKTLVRYRTITGSARQAQFKDPEEAGAKFLEWVEEMRREAAARKQF